MKYTIFFTVLFQFLIYSQLFGIEKNISLTLKESVEYALKNNLSFKKSGLNEELSDINIDRAKDNLNSNMNFSINSSQQILPSQGHNYGVSYNNSIGQVNYNKYLIKNRDIKQSLKEAVLYKQSACQYKKISRNDIVFNTKIQYWKIVNLMLLKEMEEKNVEKYQKILDVTQTKKNYGYANKMDTDLAFVQLGLVKDNLVSTENELFLAEIGFKQLLVLPEDVTFF